MAMLYIPTKDEFDAGIAAYAKREHRGPIYFEAQSKLQTSWGNAALMAEAIWILLNSWHRDFYRFGSINLEALTSCIESNMENLDRIRSRSISSLCDEDELMIRSLFRAFTEATRRKNKSGSQESTVATAKSLHLISPGLLSLWDNAIAYKYGCILMWSEDYISFCRKMKEITAAISTYLSSEDNRTPLKRIDEFNYAAYTKHWISVGTRDPSK
jgi:hypothetical protein